jgi:hypothetical protein
LKTNAGRDESRPYDCKKSIVEGVFQRLQALTSMSPPRHKDTKNGNESVFLKPNPFLMTLRVPALRRSLSRPGLVEGVVKMVFVGSSKGGR